MDSLLILMPFLYFPTDKTEYIPAAINMAICITLCILVFRWVKRYSAREQIKTKELEERILREREQQQH